MAIELSPLENLPPAVERAAGANAPAPLKLMAARGMAPLPPTDLAVALYQLSFAADSVVSEAAFKSAVELPDPILRAALAAALDPRVLDFYARRITRRAALIEVLLLNRATHDETFRHLAGVLVETELELIAKNEERLLRSPGIIAALYMNPKTRMSTAQRAVELAARNGVRVDGIPGFDDLVKELGKQELSAADDEAYRQATTVAVDANAALVIVPLEEAGGAEAEALEAEPVSPDPVSPDPVSPDLEASDESDGAASEEDKQVEEAIADGVTEEKAKKLTDLTPAGKIRVATLGNSFARSVLIRDKNRQVAMACIKSPAVSDSEALKYASNRSLDDDIIRYIANQRSWTRLPGIRVALCNNPKTPIPIVMRLLPMLNIRDLKGIARSKGIPAAIAKQAKQIAQSRGG